MATLTLRALAGRLKNLDICMMSTYNARGSKGGINSRPMSNNGDVTYRGDSFFFTYEGSQKVADLTANPQVTLNFEGAKQTYVAITGKAKLIRTRTKMQAHWVDSLYQWFKDGLDTPGIVLIQVRGEKVRYWQKNTEDSFKIPKKGKGE